MMRIGGEFFCNSVFSFVYIWLWLMIIYASGKLTNDFYILQLKAGQVQVWCCKVLRVKKKNSTCFKAFICKYEDTRWQSNGHKQMDNSKKEQIYANEHKG